MDRHTTERNLRYLVLEIFWAAIFIGCTSFNAAYLIRLGGSNFLVSMLTSGAALVNAVATLPFATWLERTPHRRSLMLGGLWVVRLGHLLLITIPWFVGWQPEAMVLLLLLLNIPVALFTAAWLPFIAEVIPTPRRMQVFAARNMTLGVMLAFTTFVLGRWLDAAPFPFNYQMLYALAVVTSCLSTLYVARIVMPDVQPASPRPPGRPSLAAVRELINRQRPFANMIGNTLIFNLAVWMAIPLQPIYFVRTLGASDGWLGLWIGLVSAGAIAGNMLWSRMIDRHGAHWVLLRTTALSAVYYFLIGAFPDLTLILVFALLSGIITPGVDLSHVNVLYDVAPTERRATAMGVFTTAMQFGAFVGPLAVAPLADLIGAQTLMLLLGVLRLAGAALFVLNPVHAQRRRRAEAA